ncbi:Gfo/Idh/MocA family protein [Leucobacter sp. wl10]|uniref:Gfo/Idh/MocA family protein n=1 Tax=Leucobacter sp. wl10 TaxID=2304677 RepID=UPI000E5BA4E3|nr:Gfo/Idh/MocA family oxidoreductase [Leucobacter sp. wl10]RGE19176.1 gfo/Idh/MocA family oxidoreductase [Leucobacter sp. wl10]
MTSNSGGARIGIVGAGTITQNVHIPAIQRLPGEVELVAIADMERSVLDQVATANRIPDTYTDYREMFARPDIDAVMLMVGDPLHVPLAIEAIEAGKDVFVEKPMGTTVEECLRLRDAVRASDRFVQIGNMRRYDAGVAFARHAVAELIGEVQSFDAWARCASSDFSNSAGAYLPTIRPAGYARPDWKLDRPKYALDAHSSHLFDHIRYVVGAPQTLSAIRGQRGENYSWQGLMDLGDGGVGRFELTYETAAPWSEGLMVYGTRGTVTLEMSPVAEHRPSRVEVFDTESNRFITPYLIGEASMYLNQMRGFGRAVRREEPPRSTVDDGLAVVMDIAATRQAVDTGASVRIEDLEVRS